MRILIARRSETQATLAAELGVSVSTVYRDIVRLTVDYPLETQRGNGGCVKVADWYHRRDHRRARRRHCVRQRRAAGKPEADARRAGLAGSGTRR